jgi:hypothetical protein
MHAARKMGPTGGGYADDAPIIRLVRAGERAVEQAMSLGRSCTWCGGTAIGVLRVGSTACARARWCWDIQGADVHAVRQMHGVWLRRVVRLV